MADLFQRFFDATQRRAWPEAYDLLNGFDTFGMLRALAQLQPQPFKELRGGAPQERWGGPNLKRINFAMDVVEKSRIPTPAADVSADDVKYAQEFLRVNAQAKMYQGGHAGAQIMEDWAARYEPNSNPGNRFLYSGAIPYLALGNPARPMPALVDRNYGNPLPHVFGLSIHCTAGTSGRDAYTMSNFGCVLGWNGRTASAHFAIAGDGTVVQFIPTSFTAFAQGGADSSWLSVEIDNSGATDPPSPATDKQLESVQRLFDWVCTTFAVPRQVATGHICGNKTYDDITKWVCAAGGSGDTSLVDSEPRMSRGLSCHRWLQPHVKPCPGAGLLSQLADIADV